MVNPDELKDEHSLTDTEKANIHMDQLFNENASENDSEDNMYLAPVDPTSAAGMNRNQS